MPHPRRPSTRFQMQIFLHSCSLHLILATLPTPLSAGAEPPSPIDLRWLREDCGDGALVHHAAGRLYLTELATGTSEFLAVGQQPEFSPDSSKIAWIDGSTAKGRMRRGDPTVHTIASGVEPSGGVHWLSNSEVALVLERHGREAWYRVSLGGGAVELPGLTRLGIGGYECDVRLGRDGIWSYVAKRTWKTSDGGAGTLPGTCSVSLSPDGRTATSLHNPHEEAPLTAIRPGGTEATLRWPFRGGFDNHRWSSNDPRYIVAVDEHHRTMVVMTPDGRRVTRIGTLGRAKHGMYGDFTVGDGGGEPWPGDSVDAIAIVPAPQWPITREGLVFAWQDARASNTILDDSGETILCRLSPTGRARQSRDFALLPGDGSFVLEPAADARLSARLAAADAMTLELLITPTARPRGAVPILTGLSAGGGVHFALQQRYDMLTAHLRLALSTASRRPRADGLEPGPKINSVDLFPLRLGRTHHVVITYRPGRFSAYLDGEKMVERSWSGTFEWTGQQLILGALSSVDLSSADLSSADLSSTDLSSTDPTSTDPPPEDPTTTRRWQGTLEGLAVYDRPLDGESIRRHHAIQARRLRDRRPTPRLVVDAELRRRRPIPRPEVYPQTLVVYDYRVSRIRVGAYDEPVLRVAHWGVLNSTLQRSIRDRTPGRTYRLDLERFDEHPELQSLKIVDDGDRFDLPLFHDPAPSSY